MTDSTWIVHVDDVVDVRIAGHDGAAYTSPPQTRDAPLALVELLVGPTSSDDERSRWLLAIAGGRRMVTLKPAP